MSKLESLRAEQIILAARCSTLEGEDFTKAHREWLGLQRQVIALREVQRAEREHREHPLRTEGGEIG